MLVTDFVVLSKVNVNGGHVLAIARLGIPSEDHSVLVGPRLRVLDPSKVLAEYEFLWHLAKIIVLHKHTEFDVGMSCWLEPFKEVCGGCWFAIMRLAIVDEHSLFELVEYFELGTVNAAHRILL